jgi:hypothetical protein
MADYLRLQSALGAVTAILAHDRRIVLRGLGALMHRVVAGVISKALRSVEVTCAALVISWNSVLPGPSRLTRRHYFDNR